jgi:hypothetical protein
MYTDEGRAAMDRLWAETLMEFEFAGIKGILDEFDEQESSPVH